MSTIERSEPLTFPRQDAWAILVLLLGFALIALSIIWPSVTSGKSAWTDEKAVAYQAASAKVHSLSMQSAGMEPENQSREFHEKLADAQLQYGDLRAELDAARSRPARIATVLRYAGVLLSAAGVLALLAKRGAGTAAS